MNSGRLQAILSSRVSAFLLPVLLTLLFLGSIIQYGPIDQEEYGNTIISALLNSLSLREGSWLLWSDALGFGTPMPIGHDSTLHPLFWAWPTLPLSLLMPLYWCLHLSLAAFFFSRLLAFFGIRGFLHAVALTTYVFSFPNLAYVYRNDWPSLFFNWAMLPLIFYYALLLVREHHLTKPVLGVIRLGLLGGLCLAKAHFGHLAVLVTVAGVVIVLIALKQPRAFLHLAASLFIAALIGAGNMSFVLSEAQLFPDEMSRAAHGGYHINQYLAAFIQPFTLSWIHHPNLLGDSTRLPAFGAPFMIVSVLGALTVCVGWMRRSQSNIVMLALACGFFLSALVSCLGPEHLFSIPSGTWQFRDPLIFSGILLAAGYLGKARLPASLVRSIVILQLAIVVTAAIPPMLHLSKRDVYSYSADQASPIVADIVEAARGWGKRIYLGPSAERSMNGKFTSYPSEFALHGLAPINGWFKGVSVDSLYPSRSLMHGQIRGHKAVASNGSLLNFLGIELVLLVRTDGLPMSIAPNLVEIWSKTKEGIDLRLYYNREVWPRAVLMDKKAAVPTPLPRWDGCELSGLLCSDVRSLVKYRMPGNAIVTGKDGRMHVAFTPSRQEQLIVFSTLYRSDWVAYSADAELTVVKIAGALLGVRVPPGVDELEIEYRQQPRLLLRTLGGLTAGGCVLLLLLICTLNWWQRRTTRDGYGKQAAHKVKL